MEFYVMKDAQEWGPYSIEDLKTYLAAGNFASEDLVWREGLTSWVPLHSVLGVPPVPPARRAQALAVAPVAMTPTDNRMLLYESQKKSAGVACGLNFIMPGVGYMYAGRPIIGIFVLLIFLACIPLTLGIGSVFIWFVGLIDGFLSVNAANKKLAARLIAG